ncbi:MAG: Nucleoside 5-triphosphatase RdgB (dHAPTP, dITP, XTP-specific) [uncultured Propionibacteriaceae bacterium]|uniref:dITP/XTP pyrophosphatase n=1 Tax=uncultured Propionibacteriaceae bacterium TaxID=257457 RepID=A0A6J4NXP5_9ACTN|nr:MAG: Nucleoside 5-triphosphatase RdgB (dHAPTP, dITP, XTP-specific) [uncultured Propionibacteriaceae bacterium]
MVLATNNAKKLAELRRMVAAIHSGRHAGSSTLGPVQVLGLSDVPPYPEPAETMRTFAGNALIKARTCVTETGMAALADDSGLTVDVLNGMPGVRSARWSGPDADDQSNNELLLRQLFDVTAEARTAQFVCAMALVLPDGTEHVRTGTMDGRLAEACSGHNGFGYDVMFVADGQTQTNGQLSAEEKDRISHRGKAVRAIVPVLLDELARLRGTP